MEFRELMLGACYRAEVFFSRMQGIAFDAPARNGEYWIVNKVAAHVKAAVDLGANQGAWTAHVLASCPDASVVAVDPDPENVALLQRRFSSHSGVTIVSAAVYAADGVARFMTAEGQFSGAGYIDPQGRIEVRTVTLETLASHISRDIDLVKCDIEGAEVDALEGGASLFRSARIGIMQIEYNVTWLRTGRSLADLFAFAAEYGYELLLATPFGAMRVPSYGAGLEDFRLRNFLLARPDWSRLLAPLAPSGRARVEVIRARGGSR